jgi:hypothetical protein
MSLTTPDLTCSRALRSRQAEGYIVPVGIGVIPEHVAILMMGGRYGSFLLVDTQEGRAVSNRGAKTKSWKINIGTVHELYPEDGTSEEKGAAQ